MYKPYINTQYNIILYNAHEIEKIASPYPTQCPNQQQPVGAVREFENAIHPRPTHHMTYEQHIVFQ